MNNAIDILSFVYFLIDIFIFKKCISICFLRIQILKFGESQKI